MKYFLSNLSIVKKNPITRQPEELFSFCFAENTSKEAEFVASGHTRLMITRMMRHISRTNPLPFGKREYAGTALRQDFPENMSIKLQMYEFFFSNILLKGMVLPFFEDLYMVGFFEKIIRKRFHAHEKLAYYKRPKEKRRYLDDLRRERTLRLRRFFKFFSRLFDSRIHNPFAQFMDLE